MRGRPKKVTKDEFGKSGSGEKKDGPKRLKIVFSGSNCKGHKLKSKLHKSSPGSIMSKKKVITNLSKGKKRKGNDKESPLKTKCSRKQSSSSSCQSAKLTAISTKENGKDVNGGDNSQKSGRRGKRKRQKGNTELDEAARLQRRSRYLLIKMKLEQNLIDAYSTEGWKGQSRDKIRPEKELQRARKQIFKCKLGLREAVRQLGLLSSVGCMEESAIAPDGSVHHEYIVCAKCKLREAFPDNDIILCDGSCNRAFHQKCLDPPLSTENIPPEDQGWYCKFCDCKTEMIDAMNAHLGTHFSLDCNWQEIFKEEAALPDNGGSLLDPEQDWPSDDSEDDDYDPEDFENIGNHSLPDTQCDSSDEASSSSSLWSLEPEVFSEHGRSAERSKPSQDTSVDSDGTTDCEVISGSRRRTTVDYTKLYDEMFGKDAPRVEQNSEDEDWGPGKKKRREKESDAATTLMALCESENKFSNTDTPQLREESPDGQTKRQLFRIPPNAVQKLRLVFAENELPDRAVKESLSKQLGLDSEKVNKWFKNARYLALRARKAAGAGTGEDKANGQLALKTSSVSEVPSHLGLKKKCFIENQQSLVSPSKQGNTSDRSEINSNKAGLEFGDDVSLKLLKESAKREKRVKFKIKTGAEVKEAEKELEKLCKIKDKLERLQGVLTGLPNRKSTKGNAPASNQQSIIYVPIAELKEKSE